MADEPIRKPRPELGMKPPETPAVESVETVEVEAPIESEPVVEEAAPEDEVAEAPVAAPAPQPVAARAIPAPKKDRLTREIEAVLEEDLTELYLKLPPAKQKQFTQKGEETAKKIRELVSKTKINVRKIFQLIRDWLKVIPGVNKFFLEQAAKIKADKIVLAAEDEKRRSGEELA